MQAWFIIASRRCDVVLIFHYFAVSPTKQLT
jgi:hypothetical protein